MDSSMYLTNWIWIPAWGPLEDNAPQFVYFRKKVQLKERPEKCVIQISADSRYKLYVNGSFVQEGPCKGDLQTWYFDRADITSFLHAGENVVAAEVLRYPADRNRRNHSLIRTEVPCLYAADEQIRTKGDEQLSFQGKSGWKCILTKHIQLVAEPARPAPLHILENAEGEEALHGWKKPGFDDSGWQDGRPYSFFDMNQTVSPWNLAERNIPAQRHRERRFCGMLCLSS